MNALSHIKVLDLSRVLAGPWASQMLADFGAHVIKIERPDVGDDTRQWGPPFCNDDPEDLSAYFLCTNRGKESVCVDLKTPEGIATIKSLAIDCDVLIENFKVGKTSELGIDYETLKSINPALVYCSITGFGQTGPYKDRPGYDFLVQAMGGLMSLTGEPDAQPQKVGVALSDIMTGLYASNGILAALTEREKSGIGQHIDLSLLDVTIASLANQASSYLVNGETPTRLGNAHPSIVPYQAFETTDGHCIIAVGNNSQFNAFCRLLGIPEIANDPRFNSNKQRVLHRDALTVIIQNIMVTAGSRHWLDLCSKNNVPAGPINSVEQALNDPQVTAREMRVELDDDIEIIGNPLKFSRTPINYSSKPPKLGEHTELVLKKLDN
jgi:crotonobetainyl-CoA:carnitine CoA-transferase CaiB-like acyl-CoA transferase